MLRRVVVAVLVLSVLEVASTERVFGDAAGGWENGNTVSVGASAESAASAAHPKAEKSSGSSGMSTFTRSHQDTASAPPCGLVPLDAAVSNAMPPGGQTPGQWYVMSCAGLNFIPSTGVFWVATAKSPNSPPGTIDPLTLAQQALRSIVLPAPAIRTNPSAFSVVNLQTWLWIDPVAWRTLSATASAGPISATAVAAPVSVTWSMGDGSSISCSGPGTAYDTAEPASRQSTDCSYTYRRSSLGQPSPDGNPNDASFDVTATIRWSVDWTAVGAPGGGALPSLQTTSTLPLKVEQVESVGTGT
jgi:hypothetical protein